MTAKKLTKRQLQNRLEKAEIAISIFERRVKHFQIQMDDEVAQLKKAIEQSDKAFQELQKLEFEENT
jgi:multidrug resistance efflux pump